MGSLKKICEQCGKSFTTSRTWVTKCRKCAPEQHAPRPGICLRCGKEIISTRRHARVCDECLVKGQDKIRSEKTFIKKVKAFGKRHCHTCGRPTCGDWECPECQAKRRAKGSIFYGDVD